MKVTPALAFTCLLSCFSILNVFSQSRVVSGKITDLASGEAMAGVTILEKHTVNAVSSQNDGSYAIILGGVPNDTIVFSFIGYENQEVAVTKSTTINIQLKEDVKMLNEVVVVAYGESSRKELTGAVGKVDAKKLADVPIASADLMLQGQVSGLQITSYSGQPGAETNIHLRGVGSITAGSTPLFVVDGIPINSGYVGDGFTITWTSNGLAGINPNDIESITVLKDASATAIYGSRGANGVIIITTKKGKAGKTKFKLDTEFGTNKAVFNKNILPMNKDEYLAATINGMDNAGYSETKQEGILESINASSDNNTDWLDVVTQPGFQNAYNLSAQGGNENTQFYISTGYFRQEGATIDSRFDRLSTSLNLEQKVTDKLHFQTSVMLSRSEQNTPYQSGYFRAPIICAYTLLPMMAPYDSTGAPNTNTDEFFTFYNPIAIEDLDTNYYNNKKVIGSIGADYELITGLKFSTQLSLDQNYTDEFIYANPFYGDGKAFNGWAQESYTDLSNWVWTNLFDYRRLLAKKIDMDLKVGHEAQKSTNRLLTAFGEGFPPNTSIVTLGAAAIPGSLGSYINEYTFESFFSNALFSYKEKYFISGSFRRDGSSRFGINNRYGSFYSVGISWDMYKASFMSGISFISAFRLRSSYGQNGNSEIGNYSWRSYYTYFGSYNGESTSNPSTLGNDNLTWEKNNPFNIGIDAAFFHDRVNLTADFYHRTTTDLLLNVPISQTTGFSTQLQNVGAMVNKGIEITVGGDALQLHAFKWNVEANFATNKNEITALYNDQEFISGYNSTYGLPIFLYRVGESYGTYYLPLYAGVDPQTGDALWYTDSTMTETTSDVENVKPAAVGNAQPKCFGGITNQFSWKGISLSAQINYVFGSQIYDSWGGLFENDGADPLYNQYNTEVDRWQNPGDETEIPKYVYYNKSGSNMSSTRYLHDGDYVRLRDVTLSYEFNSASLAKMRLSSVKLYMKGINLYTWTKDKYLPFDPDTSYGYGDANLPNIKTVTFGLNIGF